MDVDTLIRPLQLKDLRSLLRARGCSPAGGQEEMRQRLKDNMNQTGNYSVQVDGSGGGPVLAGSSTADITHGSLVNNYSRPGGMQNVGNFLTDKPSSRVLAPPGGQSQISFGDYVNPHTQRGGAPPPQYQQAPPQYQQPPPQYQQQQQYQQPPPQYQQQQYQQQPPPQQYQQSPQQYRQEAPPPGYGAPPSQVSFGSSSNDVRGGTLSNNYARPGGQQNVGNFLTDRPSSRVLAPPGGKSQITFG